MVVYPQDISKSIQILNQIDNIQLKINALAINMSKEKDEKQFEIITTKINSYEKILNGLEDDLLLSNEYIKEKINNARSTNPKFGFSNSTNDISYV